jgi:hypothetical protein
VNTGNIRCGRGRLGPLSLHLHVPERSSPSRVRSGESFQTRKRLPSAAHKPRALAGSGPFRRLTYEKGKGANAKAKPSKSGAGHRLPLVGPEADKPGSHLSRNLKIRPPPVDDVNNLRHDGKCQRCFASTAIQIRRNALFTSPEYASFAKSQGCRFKGAGKRSASGG